MHVCLLVLIPSTLSRWATSEEAQMTTSVCVLNLTMREDRGPTENEQATLDTTPFIYFTYLSAINQKWREMG